MMEFKLIGIQAKDVYFTSEDGKIKIVMDGCGSGDFSEIGTRLFYMALKEKQNRVPKQNKKPVS